MIFTIGYQNIKRKRLQSVVDELSAALVDIRYVPWSVNPFWTQVQLQEAFKENYFNIKEFGNVNYKGGPFKIFNMEKGIELFSPISDKYKNIFLMCSCKELEKCHRHLIAKEIKNKFKQEHKEFETDYDF